MARKKKMLILTSFFPCPLIFGAALIALGVTIYVRYPSFLESEVEKVSLVIVFCTIEVK